MNLQQALADFQAMKARYHKANDAKHRALKILKSLEWSAKVREDHHGGIGSDDGMTIGCPECRATKHMGHKPHCYLKREIDQ